MVFPTLSFSQLQLSWDYAGPFSIQGRILALAADPRNDAILYAGTPGGGVWKSFNGGLSWTVLQTGAISQVCSLAADPRLPDVVYLGTGDDQSPRPAQGVARSTNGGQSWIFLTRFTNQPVCTLAIDPGNSERILAGSAEGLFLSSDSGSSWRMVLAGAVTSVAFDGASRVYAGMFGADAPGARNQLLAFSADGGQTWTNAPLAPNPYYSALQTNWVGVVAGLDSITVVVSYQTTPSVAGIASSPLTPRSQLDAYRSVDGGNTWTATWGIGQSRPPVRLLTDPATRNVYVGGASLLVYRSQSANWSTIPTSTGEFHGMAISGGMLMLAGERGLEIIGITEGAAVPSIGQLSGGQFFGASFDPASGIWGAGPAGLHHVFPLRDSPDVRISGVGATGTVVTSNASNFFATGNDFFYRSTDAGARFSPRTVIAAGEPRAQVPPYVTDPALPATSYIAGRRLYRSTDNGNAWTALAIVDPDPTRVVIALAIAPSLRTSMFAATACLPEVASVACPSTSVIWRSTNSGASWVQVSSVSGLVNRLTIDPRMSGTVYAAIGSFPAGTSISAGSVAGNLLRSTDNGVNWVSIRNNLPAVPVNTLIIDPAFLAPVLTQPAPRLYVGTDAGVFVTFNAGTQWIDISGSAIRSLPATPITDLSIRSDGTLLAATFGRGIYYASTTGLAPGVIANSLSLNVTLMEGTTTTTGISLTNVSTLATLGWAVGSGDAWITAPVSNGSLRPNTSLEVAIRISAQNLRTGEYRGSIQVISSSYVQNVLISAQVTPAPAAIQVISNNNPVGAAGGVLGPVQVLVLDSNAAPLPHVPVVFAITSGGGSLNPRTVSTDAAGMASTIVSLPSTPGTVRILATSGDVSAAVTAMALAAPVLLSDGVVDGVTLNNYTPLGPGGIVSMSGTNLARATVIAPNVALPTSLQATRAILLTAGSEIALPLLSVAPNQIRALLPFDIAPGFYRVQAELGSVRSNAVQISVAAFAPGIFTATGSGRGLAVFIKADGSPVSASNPADRGSTVTFFAAGLGNVSPPIAAGQTGATREPLNRTITVPRVFFDSQQAEVVYNGLSPGSAERYQVTVRVPTLISPATNVSVSLTIGGFTSNRVTIPVR